MLVTRINYAQTWNIVTPVSPTSDIFRGQQADIAFVNKNVGWLFTTNQYIRPYGDCYNKLYRTTDGGMNWEIIISDTGYFDIYRMFPRNSDNLTMFYNGNDVLITNDGGVSWDTSEINDNQSTIWQLSFLSDNKAIAFNNYRWFTSDGGYSWKRNDDTLTTFFSPTDSYFINDSLGWIVSDINLLTDVGYIAATTNGGKTWEFQRSITNLLYGVEFLDSLKGFAVGYPLFFDEGALYYTNDGGKNWGRKSYDTFGKFYDIGFIDSLNGWITGVGKIMRTTDGGENWEIEAEGFESDLKKLIILKEDKVAYVFGDDWNGETYTFLKADLSDLTDVNEDNNNRIDKFELIGNYPNPFNPSTTIKFTIPASLNPSQGGTLITLKVYDILGREIKTLVDENKTAGEYSVTWDGKDKTGNEVSSGIYFYNIRFGEKSISKKMVLMR